MRVAWGALSVLSILLLGFGVYLHLVVEEQLRESLRTDLASLRDAHAEALSEWISTQERAAWLAASDPEVRTSAFRILSASASDTGAVGLANMGEQRTLRRELEPALYAWTFGGYLLVHRGRVIGSDDLAFVGARLSEQQTRVLSERLRDGESYLTRPQMFELGGHSSSTPVMWVATALRADGETEGILGFRIDPTAGFSRILESVHHQSVGQTYAFDADGLLLSAIKYQDQLRERGLLAQGKSPVLRLVLIDPQAKMRAGADGSPNPKSVLTEAVQSARKDVTGENVKGYRDYRGEQVLGAWTWFERYGFGIVVEVSREKAFASVATIRRATQGLLASLAVAGLVMLFFARMTRGLSARQTTLGQYTLEREIGEGGMGTVYLARHALLRRPTAIKMIKSDQIDELTRKRFEREVQTTAELTHPNTIAIYDYGQTQANVFYYAMEYLRGKTLKELVEKTGALSVARVVHVLTQTCGALAEAHSVGLVHRDVKPSNIMLCNRGGLPDFVKVLDFGLVKVQKLREGESALTMDTSLTGTPHYMAPEVIVDSTEAEPRSDIYAVGATAFYLLTGRLLFSGPNVMAVLTKHLSEPPPSVDENSNAFIPRRLSALISQCLEKEPHDRPESAESLRQELEAIASEEGLSWTSKEAADWWGEHQDVLVERKKRSVTQTVTVKMTGRGSAPLAAQKSN